MYVEMWLQMKKLVHCCSAKEQVRLKNDILMVYYTYVLKLKFDTHIYTQTDKYNYSRNKYNNWCKASKLIAPALTTIWSQIFKMGSWKKNKKKQQCIVEWRKLAKLVNKNKLESSLVKI